VTKWLSRFEKHLFSHSSYMSGIESGRDNSASSRIVLELGDQNEIYEALKELWATESTAARARTSFFVKIPGVSIEKTPTGFKIGGSLINDPILTTANNTNQRFSQTMAANDSTYALAA
jgi:hypothetical protein